MGYLPNLTHGPLLAGLESERLAGALAGTAVEGRAFRAGPRIAEALLGRAIDIAVAGPAPILATHARHPSALRVLAGVCSGGASLVARREIHAPADLAGQRVATPQLGSTQDVSLRKWLAGHDLASAERGGDVHIDALASADIFGQMQRGRIAAAWLPEPWASRVVIELGAQRLVDERDLWPEGRFPTALLVVRREFAAARSAEVETFASALAAEVEWATRAPEAPALVFAAIKRLTTKGLPQAVVDEAWSRVAFTSALESGAIDTMAEDARALGYLPHADTTGLYA